MTDFPFKFSIIMAVYNVAPFLSKAIDSVLTQTIGFKKNVQLILINDGSTDHSGELCQKYLTRYPGNIFVIHKENRGVSSARNLGLHYVKGEYINFLDGDDALSANALQLVYHYFKTWKTVEMVTIPVHFFDGAKGEHRLNNKFHKGSRIIQVLKEYQYPLFFINATFITHNLAKEVLFDERLSVAEDAKVVLQILLRTHCYGAVFGPVYRYRKRTTGGASALQQSRRTRSWYVNYMEFFAKWAITESEKIMGYIPKFVQYALLYDLQWRYEIPNLPYDVLTSDEIQNYISSFPEILKSIDEEIIISQKLILPEYKLFILRQKYGCLPFARIMKNDVGYYFHSKYLYRQSQASICIERLQIRNDHLQIDISHKNIGFVNNGQMKWFLKIDDQIVPLKRFKKKRPIVSLGTIIAVDEFFSASLLLTQRLKHQITIFSEIDGLIITQGNICLGSHLTISKSLKNWYCVSNNYVLSRFRNKLILEPYKCGIHLKKEFLFLKELLNTGEDSAKKAIILRLAYYIQNVISHKNVCLLIGEPPKSFIILEKYKSPGEIWYIVKKNKHADTTFLNRTIKQVSSDDKIYKWYYLCSKKIVIFREEKDMCSPFGKSSLYYNDIICKKLFILAFSHPNEW